MGASQVLNLNLPAAEILVRLGSATLVGALIGLNRELRHKAAGLRTQALVALGCATAALVISGLADASGSADLNAISRVIQGVLTGVGFLGGGAIVRGASDTHIQGLTTAASIWISATLGLACGVGLWMLALCVMILALSVLRGGVWIEGWVHRRHRAEDC
ncbi:MAG: MgtC/SapB family protein [Limisphaerales bacterium]